MITCFGAIRKTLAAAGIAVSVVAVACPAAAQGQLAASDGTPSASEGPFAENFTFSNPPVPAPSVPFQTLDGAQVSLADFLGQVLVVNFWATWCAPCVREMPDLQRLHLALEDEGLAVLAVSQDRAGIGAVAPFLERLDLQRLPVYLDARGNLARAFAIKGLPTTFIIDRQGRVVAGLVGPADWDSAEAKAFLRDYLRKESPVKNTSG